MPSPDARITHAARLHQARNYPAAEQAYRYILARQPNHPEALLMLGTLLSETGRHEESVDTLLHGIAVTNRPVDLRRAMVGPLMALGDLNGAIDQAREVVRLTPSSPDGHLIIAQLFTRAGNFTAAESHARKTIELSPSSAVGWLVLARILTNTGRPGDALSAFDRAVAVAPTFADAIVERAYQLQQLGRLEEAVDGYQRGLQLVPQNLTALNNVGNSYVMLGRPDLAVPYLERAARLSPGLARPLSNLGVALHEDGRLDEALPRLQEAAKLDPTYTPPLNNIGLCHAAVGNHLAAIDSYRAAEQVDPEFDGAGSNALMSILAMDGVEPAAVRVAHVDWGHRYADPAGMSPPVIADPQPGRRLRIGYVSPDFREHSVRYFIEPVLANHDRSAVEVIGYVTGRRRDDVSKRIARLTDHWHDAAGLDAAQLAELIRSHNIDVLVDLAGHTADGRLLTFARRPAPVQVAYLGYPATTGVRAVQYRLTDALADPPGVEPFYVEKLVRLPDAFFVYADDPAKPYDGALPADRNGHVTFGAFNSFSKVTPATLAAWATIVAAVPGSRLILKGRPILNPTTRAAVLAAFAAAGVAADRIDLRTWVSMAEHTALLGSVDLALDTFPYNGHTTTCQAMWMGAPTLTQFDNEFRSRVGLDIMTRLGHLEFVVPSTQAYVQRAIELATDLTKLRELRPTWRERMVASPLCDAPRFTRGLEAAYRQMWTSAAT